MPGDEVCATEDENPLTSVRGRGHSSHLVCRTSGFLLLCPPPPSPSHLHGGFLFWTLQKAMEPEWCAKGWMLERFSALSFMPTLMLLQYNFLYILLSSSPSLLIASAIQLLPFCFLIEHTHPSTPRELSLSFPCRVPPLLFLPALLRLSYLFVRAEGGDCAMQEAKATPAAAAPGRCLVIFLKQRKGLCSSHLVSSSGSSAVCRLQSEDR